jgi:hypothetical protein
MELIEREGFGDDVIPDLLSVNFKMIDYISHVWTVNSPEMRDAVEAQDEQLEVLVEFLDETVGEGQWAFVLTADHGSIPDPDVTGAFQISSTSIVNGLARRFDDQDDVRLVELVQPTQIFVNETELRENGHTLEEMSEWIMDLTKGDTKLPGIVVPASEADDPVFQAAFPSAIMSQLDCLPEART